MKDISKKSFWLVIITLICIRIIMVILLMNDIPYVGVQEGGWWFHHGGDEVTYFDLGKSFADFAPVETKEPTTIGFPLYLAPFIYIFQATEIKDILKPVFILHAFVFYGLAIILVGLIAKKILKNRMAGIFAAFIFTFLPYIFYFLFKDVGPIHQGFASGLFNFEQLMWVHILTDPLSAFLIYFSFYLFLIFLEKEKVDNKQLILLGVLSGLSVLVRINNIFFVMSLILVLVGQKKIKRTSLVAGFSLFAFLPQLIYNFVFFGSPILFKNLFVFTDPSAFTLPEKLLEFKTIARPSFSIQNYYYYLFLMDKYIPKVELILIGLITLFVFGAASLYKKNKIVLVPILLWLFLHLAFYGLYSAAARNARYHLSIIPILIILGISSLLFIFQILTEI